MCADLPTPSATTVALDLGFFKVDAISSVLRWSIPPPIKKPSVSVEDKQTKGQTHTERTDRGIRGREDVKPISNQRGSSWEKSVCLMTQWAQRSKVQWSKHYSRPECTQTHTGQKVCFSTFSGFEDTLTRVARTPYCTVSPIKSRTFTQVLYLSAYSSYLE